MPPPLLRGRGRFTAGPLSVGVPLEGTDTVAGLRALERREAATRIDGLLTEAAKHGFHASRKYARYRGPYLESLTLASVTAPPRPWRALARSTPPLPLLTLPSCVDALRERVEENVVAFAANYARAVAGVVVCAALLWRPSSLVGLAALAALWAASAAGWLGPAPSLASLNTLVEEGGAAARPASSAGSDSGGGAPPPLPPALGGPPTPAPTPNLRAVATLAAYMLATYTRAFVPISRGAWWGGLACAAHAALRAAPSEAAAAGRAGGRLTASHTLRDVVWGPTPATPGDPRRLLREVAGGVAALARAAALAARAGAAAGVDSVKVRVKAAWVGRRPRMIS